MALDTHETHAPTGTVEAPVDEQQDEGQHGVARRLLLLGGGGAVALGLTGGLWAWLRGDEDQPATGTTGTGVGTRPTEAVRDTSDQFNLSVIGDAIERSPQSQQALAKLLGVSAASLQIQVPPQESWQPGVPEVTFAQVTSTAGQGSVHLTLPQRGTLGFAQMKEALKGSRDTRWFTLDQTVVAEVTAPQRGTPGLLGWESPGAPQESVFGMDVVSPALNGMTTDQKARAIWDATVTLLHAGVFERPPSATGG